MLSQEVHNRRSSSASRWGASVIAGVAALASVAWAAAPASAHDELISATPAADERVAEIPPEVRLTFSGVISAEPGATAIEVVDDAGTSVVAGAPVVEENTVTQQLDAASGASGPVRVVWRVVSSDGHPISGEYSFTVTAPPALSPTETATDEPTTSPSPTRNDEPTATAEPTAPADRDSTFADVWPWLVLGIVATALAGALLYLGVSRVGRQNALGERPPGDAGPRSEPPADH